MEYKGVFSEINRDGHYPVRLCGVLHFGCSNMYPLPDSYEQAYGASDCIAFETDMDAIAGYEFISRMRELGTFDEGMSLKDALSADTFTELMTIANELGFSETGIAHYRPWYCASLLTNTSLQRTGLASGLGIDAHIHSRAKSDGKETLCLETPESQLEILKTIDGGDADSFMRNTIRELRNIREFSENLLRLWREGNAKRLQSLLSENFRESPEQQSAILAERNKRWATVLEEKSRKCSVMAVVGAGHLIGNGSLAELLLE